MFFNGRGLVRMGGRSERLKSLRDCPHEGCCTTWEECNAKIKEQHRKEHLERVSFKKTGT